MKESSKLKRKTVKIKSEDPELDGQTYRVEDWWEIVYGNTWMGAANEGNPAAIKYMARLSFSSLPRDNDVLYGKIGHFGHLIHISEIVEE